MGLLCRRIGGIIKFLTCFVSPFGGMCSALVASKYGCLSWCVFCEVITMVAITRQYHANAGIHLDDSDALFIGPILDIGH